MKALVDIGGRSIELARLPYKNGETYEEVVGKAGLHRLWGQR